VAGVDEQEIAGPEGLDDGRVEVLHAGDDQLDIVAAAQERARIGLDAADRGRAAFMGVAPRRAAHAMGRDAGADLQDAGGLEIADHAMQALRLDVAEAEPVAVGLGLEERSVAAIFRLERTHPLREPPGLGVQIDLDPVHRRRPGPARLRARELVGVGDR